MSLERRTHVRDSTLVSLLAQLGLTMMIFTLSLLKENISRFFYH